MYYYNNSIIILLLYIILYYYNSISIISINSIICNTYTITFLFINKCFVVVVNR